jgi:hypothetical protein
MMQPRRFPFLDEGEALRRLNVDRDTLLGLVRDGRLRAYSGFGKGNFYRMRDLDTLYAELYGVAGAESQGAGAEEATPGKGKPFDPSYKVHVRLQADLKWYDLSDDDLRAWVRELHEDGYARQRTNITNVIGKLQRLIELMDEAAANWRVLQPGTTPAPPAEPAPSAPPSRRGRNLPMLGGSTVPTPPALSAPVVPTRLPDAAPKRGKPLPMAGMGPPRDSSDAPSHEGEE